MMKIQCDYCGNTYEDTQPNCPSCGAPNQSHNDNDVKPRTIQELKKWYADRKLPPPEITRFFIGVNYRLPRAFGIYKDDNGDFIVYKNKADGSRAIRYKGKDEQYAVNELWLKLKDEIVHQKSLNSRRTTSSHNHRVYTRTASNRTIITMMIIWLVLAVAATSFNKYSHRNDGYYKYDNAYYYNDANTWYIYDNLKWYETTVPDQYDSSYSDPYYMGRTYEDIDWKSLDRDFNSSSSENLKNFSDVKNSQAYQNNHTSNDSDYDWGDNDSWDSGGTDWDSDW